ncbi:hypothetical protein CNMCM5623_006928 [Aspergillus felis]|uniref:Uncharacterized protein n=1 Tax=Aspergillus felis TaxID=1287682 RepID=A0A8H6V578_9EURO|nr:hypothetical protein CNMCM5623_006928 [Aspergillus felis]
MVRRTRRDIVRPLAARLALRHQLPQAFFVCDPEAGGVQAYVCPHQPRQLDVAYLVITGVRPIDPVFLDEAGGEAGAGGSGGDLAGVVGLDAADGDEGCGVCGEGVGEQVLEFAGFVAAVGEGGVEVLAFRVDGGV